MRCRIVAIAVTVVLVVAACGDDDSATTGAPTSGSDTTAPVTTTAPATTVPEAGPPLFEGLDARVVLLTPTSDAGRRPLLEWEAVTGVDHYAVFLYAPSGEVYWSWAGTATAVHVGGEPQLREGAAGPGVIDGMSWSVIAYDADLLPIAVSEQRPIAP